MRSDDLVRRPRARRGLVRSGAGRDNDPQSLGSITRANAAGAMGIIPAGKLTGERVVETSAGVAILL